MSELKFVTKGNSSPENKPKVYFTCHPIDFERAFRSICEDIFKVYDCAIFYTEDMARPLDEETREIDLNTMNLFVIPVTFRLLTEANRAMDEDFVFAKEHHIPVLPIMLESGIDTIYSREDKFGKLQYLSPNDNDRTRRSYEDQLKSFFDSVFINKETVGRVRKAFDAYIFLSYRKKDRRYANELMRMIHERPELQRLAIWYDEFLTPGESFMENIRKILDDSRMMALLVTPSLLEKPNGLPNFVMDKEYPAALEAGMPILPAEMVKTDPVQLREDYTDIPDPIDVYDESIFDEQFLNRLRELITEENSEDPEHNYLVGLAYLYGIDVEADKERALRMITASAEAELPEAMERLRDMYKDGFGVEQDYQKALKWGHELYEYYCRTFGEEDGESLIALNNLAIIYQKIGDYQQCMTLMERCCAMRLKDAEENVEETLIEMGNLAVAYSKTGKYQMALRIDEKCYRMRKEMLGEKHHDTLTSLNNLALTYSNLGDYHRALELSEKSYRLHVEVLGEKHPETLKSLSNLAAAYADIGNHQKAKELALECWQSSKETLGEKHLDTLLFLNNLASDYRELGDYHRALELSEKCYRLRAEVLGEKHPDTLNSLGNLAAVYADIGEYHKSLEIQQKCYELRCEVLGEKHPDTLLSLNNLACAYADIGDHHKALELAEECYQLRLEVLGEKHLETLTSMNNLASDYGNLGEKKRALEMHQKCYELRCEVLGEKHPDTLLSLNNLACAYADIGDRHRALELSEKCCHLRMEVLGDKHPDTLTSMNNLASVYHSLGDYHKAFEMYQKCYELRREALGERHPGTLDSLNNYAIAYGDAKDLKKSLEISLKCWQLRKETLGEKHPDTEHSMYICAESYYLLGEYQKALPLLEQSFQIKEKTLGKTHALTLNVMREIAYTYYFVDKKDDAIRTAVECCERAFSAHDENSAEVMECLTCVLSIAAKGGYRAEGLRYADYVYEHPQIRHREVLQWTVECYKTFGQHDRAGEIRQRM